MVTTRWGTLASSSVARWLTLGFYSSTPGSPSSSTRHSPQRFPPPATDPPPHPSIIRAPHLQHVQERSCWGQCPPLVASLALHEQLLRGYSRLCCLARPISGPAPHQQYVWEQPL